MYVLQVRLLPDQPVGPTGNSDAHTLQRHLGHERPQARPHAEADVQDDTSVLQLAGQYSLWIIVWIHLYCGSEYCEVDISLNNVQVL